jgi:hypothetical protein
MKSNNNYELKAISLRAGGCKVCRSVAIGVPFHHDGWSAAHMRRSTKDLSDIIVFSALPYGNLAKESLRTVKCKGCL